jgi:hypothetical protein
MKDETYYFHQTPEPLCKFLVANVPLVKDDVVLEAFRGEGSFYNSFPEFVKKEWCEIEEGKCYTSFQDEVDWVVTNPPFRLETGSKRINSFYYLLDYYSTRVRKGIAFLANDRCFSTLTPNRLESLRKNGLYLSKIITCSIKKWRGRYFFLIFEKKPCHFFDYLLGNY